MSKCNMTDLLLLSDIKVLAKKISAFIVRGNSTGDGKKKIPPYIFPFKNYLDMVMKYQTLSYKTP